VQALLEVEDLCVQFSARDDKVVRAADGVGFHIHEGESLGLLGESGSGKSVTALSLLRLLPPGGRIVEGRIRFRGEDLSLVPDRRMQQIRGSQIAMIFQEPGIALCPVVSVGSQIADVIATHRGWPKDRCRKEAEQLLSVVGLPEPKSFFPAFPHQLSGGQLQRVVIALALAGQPKLLIADEPTTALDMKLQHEVLMLVQELRKSMRMSVLWITHDPDVLRALADRIVVMYAGRVVEVGSAEQILHRPQHPYTVSLLRCAPQTRPTGAALRKQPLPVIAGNVPNLASLPMECRFAPRCPERMDICTEREPGLIQMESGGLVRCFKYGG